MGWFELFRPPEWGLWKLSERLLYLVGLGSFLFLIGRGAVSLVKPLPPLF